MPEKIKKKGPGTKLWKPGQSGNPAGRPKGSVSKTTQMKQIIEGRIVSKLDGDAVKIYEKCLHMAMGGDSLCIKLLMDRLLPRATNAELEAAVGNKGITINISGMGDTDKGKVIDIKETEDAELVDTVSKSDRD